MASLANWSLDILRCNTRQWSTTKAATFAAKSLRDLTGGRRPSYICLNCRSKHSRQLHASKERRSTTLVSYRKSQSRINSFHSSCWLTLPTDPHTSQHSNPRVSDTEESASTKYTELQDEAERFQREWKPGIDIPDGESSRRSESQSSAAPLRATPESGNAAHTPFGRRVPNFSNSVIDSLSRIAHQLNIYTGTDFTPIQNLRNTIKTQELSLRSRHQNIASAKVAHSTAIEKQRSHQKEVVQLLERKHSWADTDMERYMGLIRSEHVNERAVEHAQRGVIEAERALEEARQELERNERKMYHEEQVWSDTIRRNSTWITFGLMGFNIILLLTQIVIVEPWRRKRLVNEVKSAMDSRKLLASSSATSEQDTAGSQEQAEVETETDKATAVFPADDGTDYVARPTSQVVSVTSEPVVAAEEQICTVEHHSWRQATALPLSAFGHLPPHPFSSFQAFSSRECWLGLLDRLSIVLNDKFSNRILHLTNADFTSARLETLSVGVLFGSLSVLLGVLFMHD